ncbi:MAG TPA: hypothetical protein VFS48_08065, partial [Solirubrobacterales bacterium]|nr:hypothetical protein [Solirubrobacterales bacterium]
LLATCVGLMACASLANATVIQQGNLRITVLSQVQPYKLPRVGTAPIAVFVSGHLEAPKGGVPPQLQRMTVEVNKHGLLQSKGLPTCPLKALQPASTERAMASCADAVIGSGQFWAHIVLPDQGAYPTHGRLLIFNGRQGGKPVIFTHIFTANPFFSSFVIPFTIAKANHGAYGTKLTASLPQALGDWGYVDRIKLTLKRKYSFKGKQLSYFNAGCPAPKGVKRTVFPLALASFDFAAGLSIAAKVEKACAVKE